MKKIIKPRQYEEAEFYCDKCNTQCYGSLRMSFGYGSNKDMNELEVDLCDKCADKIIKYIKKNINNNLELKEICI